MQNLPSELIDHIASYVPISTKAVMGRACSIFRDVTYDQIQKTRNQIPWRISVEYAAGRYGTVYETRVKIGWFDVDSPRIYKEDWMLKNSKLIVIEGVGGEIGRQILDEYPTLKIKLRQRMIGPLIFEILPNEAKNEIGYDYDYADVEIGSLSPIKNTLKDSRIRGNLICAQDTIKYTYSLYQQPKTKKRKRTR